MQTITIKLTDKALAEVRKLGDHYAALGCGPDGPLDDPLGHVIELAIMDAARGARDMAAQEGD
ncbi:MAG: hypothetical protein OXI11_08725 [Gammaproteobacteria bacterium]|nr:hypothetical protein [Gammaproteobacteria bacterium]